MKVTKEKDHKKPTHFCTACRRHFYGRKCFDNHKYLNDTGTPATETKPSVCHSYQKCSKCFTYLKYNDIKKHKCGFETCTSCHNYVEIKSHQCYLEVEETPQEKRKRRRLQRQRKRAQRRRESRATGEEVSSSSDESSLNEDEDESSSHIIFFDIESMLVSNEQVPNLLIASNEKEPEETFHIFRNKVLEDEREYSCIEQFLDYLE